MSELHPVNKSAAKEGNRIGRGRLICFEGLDGAGKTTTGALLAEVMSARGEPAVFIEKKATCAADTALADRMARLKTLIWDYGDAPIAHLGDSHSLYIMASWFAAFDRAIVAPRLAAGLSVVVDNWFHKFLARFELKVGFDFDHVRRCFADLTPIDSVVFLDIDPELAARRKRDFTQAETGNLDGLSGRSAENFVRYQAAVRGALRATAAASPEWLVVAAGADTPQVLAEMIADRLGPLPQLSRGDRPVRPLEVFAGG
jgi:thymidylate kinase